MTAFRNIRNRIATCGASAAATCAIVSSLLLTACSLVTTTSRFPHDKVKLGMNMHEVKAIMGKPFGQDAFAEGNKNVHVLYYNEALRVQTQGLILTTSLRFENDTLTSINQNKVMPVPATRDEKAD